MRFMVIVKASKDSEAGVMPSQQLLHDMEKFNEELAKAGVLLAADGLQASSKGARVKFSGKKRIVTDGPFAETKELIAGYWIWQCKSKQEAIEWVKRCPNPHEDDGEIEIRQIFEAEDFAAAMTAMAKLRPHVDTFFDKVTVNVDDKALRENRLKLLSEIRMATRTVADFSKIEG